jgi:hypothetical protein
VLWRKRVPKSEAGTGGRREWLYNLYSSPNIIRVIKSKRMRWAGHVAHMVNRNAHKISVKKPNRNRPVGRPGSRWGIILK